MSNDSTGAMSSPKLFVSYSWTNPDHEAWVLRLATELRESGIDVILDKWDLKEGHDAHAFMERIVTDPAIKKVILICDKSYAEKTDGRTGGVGTEAQIISPEIYAKQDQNKFVAVVKERDEKGRAYLPIYYRSRIYIDLSDSSSYTENFETLLRWIYDQPLHQKPNLGTRPAFLSSGAETALSLATSVRLRRALDAIRNSREYALPATAEYFETLARELEKFRIDGQANPFDDAVVQSIEHFLPYRNEAIEVFVTLAAHIDSPESRRVLHRFFEQMIPYMGIPENVTTYRESDWDNFKFIVHELFLYAVASLIRFERFLSASHLMSAYYYVPSLRRQGSDAMVSFVAIRKHIKSLIDRNTRLELNRLSVRADLLKQRCQHERVEFSELMQADFILFMRSELNDLSGIGNWWPETLVFRAPSPFEVFARSRSKSYFDRAKVLLGVDDKEAVAASLKRLATNPRQLPRWAYEGFDPQYLLGFDKLATAP